MSDGATGDATDGTATNLLAIDVGTSAVKAAVVTTEGRFLAVERTPVPPRRHISADQDTLWDIVAGTIKRVTDHGRPVDAVAVTGQGDGLWTIGADGRPAGPTYEWNTAVAADVVTDWEEDGTIEGHFRRTGTVLWSGASAAIWRWLRITDPAFCDRVRHVFNAKDWINYRLCGVVATDVTDATIPFLDLAAGRYDPASFERLGCEDLAKRMAPIVEMGSELGGVSQEAAAATGLAAGTPVLMGCIDGLALMGGAGLVEPGQALAVLGTTAAALVITDRVETAGEPVGALLKVDRNDRYLRFMGATSGTSTLDWFLEAFHYTSGDRLAEFWADVAEGRPGVVMLPYLAGERVPFLAPDATGTFLGLTPQTGRPDIARSVVNGITFSLRHCLDSATSADVHSIVLSGGGAGAPQWCQLVADVTGRTVEVDERPHVACAGVMHGATGTKPEPLDDPTLYHPETDHEHEYQQFVRLSEELRPIWTGMSHDAIDHDHTEEGT